ncbi:unnamed protein product, partial [Timema podura]|nr:unnamed protein product [Timema podura]
RCEESTGIGALYSSLLREHNRVAQALSELNTLWDDETVFQEARRVLAAEIQHITYKEFLPTVLGDVVMKPLELELKDQGYYTGYSSSNHAGIFNSVATSALPIFLSMIPSKL